MHTNSVSEAKNATCFSFPLPTALSIMSNVTIFQHRTLLIFIPPVLVFCSLSTFILNTPIHPHPSSLLSIPFLSFLYPGIPMGTPVFLSNVLLCASSPRVSIQGAEREEKKKEGGGVGARGIYALICFIRILEAQRLLSSTLS